MNKTQATRFLSLRPLHVGLLAAIIGLAALASPARARAPKSKPKLVVLSPAAPYALRRELAGLKYTLRKQAKKQRLRFDSRTAKRWQAKLRCRKLPACLPKIAKALKADRLVLVELKVKGAQREIVIRVLSAKGQELHTKTVVVKRNRYKAVRAALPLAVAAADKAVADASAGGLPAPRPPPAVARRRAAARTAARASARPATAPATATASGPTSSGTPPTTVGKTHTPKGKGIKLGLLVGVKVGVAINQAFSPLGAGPVVELEAGYQLPFIGRRLGVVASLSYSQANASGRGFDSRLPGGGYDWALTQQQLMLSIGVSARLFKPFRKIGNAYVAVGPRFFFLKTLQEEVDSNNIPFGEWQETETRVGAFVTLGGEIYLGPGSLFVEFEFRYNTFTATLTGDSNGSALRLALGYRILM